MWTTKGVPIGPFLDKFVHLARAENYKYLMLLVARPADEYAVYENLYNDWRSIHEVTGPDIMFLFVGSDAGNCNEMAGFIEDVNHESPLHFSPHIAVTGGGGHLNPRKEKGLRNGYGLASLTEHVRSRQEFSLLAESHESQIRDLRKRFSLLEAELPALVLISLSDYKRYATSVRGITSLYPLLKCLIDEIESIDGLKIHLSKLEAQESFAIKVRDCYADLQNALARYPSQGQTPIAELAQLIQLAHPWNTVQVSRQINHLMLRIKADPDISGFYKAHRGKMQRFSRHLVQIGESKQLIDNSTSKDLIAKIDNKSRRLIENALDSHTAKSYRSQTGSGTKAVIPVDVFISYSRKDVAAASVLKDSLTQRGYSVWMDREIRAGFAFRQEIRTALLSAGAVLVIWSESSVQSEWVEWEAATAHKKRCYLPVRDGSISEHDLPPPFGNYHCLPLEDIEQIDLNLVRLLAVTKGHDASDFLPFQVEADWSIR